MRLAIKLGVAAGMLAAAGVAWCAPATGDAGSSVVAGQECRKLLRDGKGSEAQGCFETLTRSGRPDERAEGFWGLAEMGEAQWEDAKAQFELAVARPEAQAIWKARYGTLLHERFNNADSPPLFREALAQDPKCAEALLGLAMVSADGFDDKAQDYAAQAIAADPKLVEAHEFSADLLLADAKPDEAMKEADVALGLEPDALDAMAVHAAAALLADKSADADAWVAKMKAVNPGYGNGYLLIAKQMMLGRRYPDAIAYDRKAVEADPELWSAHSDLGINLMRMGEQDEARKELELAYKNGFTDTATSNSLNLLELYPKFVTTKDATTTLMLWKTEDDLLRPYFEEQLHKAIATYSAKYKMTLKGPVQLEVYPNHEDFAVRTMGMPGLGALGVTFGNVVAMDSPSGRKPGDFNWGATMWHEMSHVFILSETNYHVPRWFTEGLAVHEEGQVDPRWANHLTAEDVAAIKSKKLLPVKDLDQGFLFPQYPEQVLVSYWQGGTICDYIQERWGNDALLGMVKSFAALKTTTEAIEANLGQSPEQFDRDYAAWLDKHVGATVANFDKWRAQLKALVASAEAKQDDAVIAAAPAVIQLYPQYVEDANAYEILANAQLMKENKQGAMETLEEYERRGGEDPKTLEKLATLEEELGHPKDAAATLSNLNFIYPEDQWMHTELGKLWLTQGNNAGALREYQAVVAMKPLDMAQAEYNVAKAYYAAGDKAKAEESVLASLESAPGFKDAQKLLLELEGSK